MKLEVCGDRYVFKHDGKSIEFQISPSGLFLSTKRFDLTYLSFDEDKVPIASFCFPFEYPEGHDATTNESD
jgi:hypothetical protein